MGMTAYEALMKAFGASKNYTDKSIAGAGAIKGKNCTIQSIVSIEGGNRVTFKWTLDNGTVETDPMDVMDGLGIKSVDINSNNHLIVTYDDNTTHDAGLIKGGGGGGASALSDLLDVDLSTLSDGDVLVYDNTSEQWVNESPEEGVLVEAVLSKSVMPTASANYNGIPVLYIGSTSANYTKGHTYVCEASGGTYSWVELGSTGEPKIVHDDEGTEYTISPNILHVFSEPKDTLTINFAPHANENIVNDYHFIFESGETPTALTLPASVVMPTGSGNIPSNSILEVSIVENLAIVQSWPQS